MTISPASLSAKCNRLANLLIWAGWAALSAYHLATLDSLPAGLHYDEAYNALDAARIGSDGFWPVFLTGNNGREALMHYVMAAALHLFGPHVWAARLPAAAAWIASLPALCWFVRELHPTSPVHRTRLWLAAAPIFTTSLWFSVTAHNAIRISFFVMFETLFLAALWRAWNRPSLPAAVLAGALGGLAAYTYLPSRLLPLLLLLMLALGLVLRRPPVLRRLPILAISAAVALVMAVPLLAYFAANPFDLIQRTAQVSVAAAPTAAGAPDTSLTANLPRVAGMFFSMGDDSPRSNLIGRPVFTLAVLPLLLAGIVASLRTPLSLRRAFVPLWALVMLLATLLSDSAPSFQRAIGAFPPAVLLVAEGAAAIASLAATRLRSPLLPAGATVLIAAGVLFESGAGLAAFPAWANQPALALASDTGLAATGKYLASLPAGVRFYLTPLSNPASVAFYFIGDPVRVLRSFDGRNGVVIRPAEDITYAILVQEDDRTPLALASLYPGLSLSPTRTLTDAFGRPLLDIVNVPAAARPRPPDSSLAIAWTDGISLEGFDLTPCCAATPGQQITLRPWWKTTTKPAKDWTVFVHLVDAGGQWTAGQDGPPAGGSYRTTAWEPGDILIDEIRISIPQTASPGDYTLHIGLYQWPAGNRLPLASGGDSALLGTITIR